jgi:hypothetical protein
MATAFESRLAARLPGANLETFSPPLAFDGAPSWLVHETRTRLLSADAVLCLLGGSSAAQGWVAWLVGGALEAEKTIVCVRLHDSMLHDVAPPIVGAHHVPVLNADVGSVVALLGGGSAPLSPSPLGARFAQRR